MCAQYLDNENDSDAQFVRWIFDKTPPSGKRRGGNPSEYAFEADLETFVREVIQNANDQGDEEVEVDLRLFKLSDDKLRQFLDAIGWESLRRHLNAACTRSAGEHALLEQYLEQFDEQREMWLLRIEDRNTEGLTGAEFNDESHFTALCKDDLVSHKKDTGAGGSYGLGKSVLWNFSGVSTVLFCSNLKNHREGQRSPRLIGRVELPSHCVEDGEEGQWYTGSGWLGRQSSDTRQEPRAVSVWGDEAESVARELFLERPDDTGTSILVTGFRDPTDDQERPPAEFVELIHEAAAKYFWPAVVRDYESLTVTAGQEDETTEVGPESCPQIRPFVQCFRQIHEAESDLGDPGDVAKREIHFPIPAKRDGTANEITGRVTLLVRLAEPGDPEALEDHVAQVRRPGMVVRYWRKSRLAIGAKTFHAIVLAGKAHPPEMRDEKKDAATEEFLRNAEPPGHNKWQSTKALKRVYKRGYGTALDTLHDNVREELKDLVVPTPSAGERGPDKLRRRFPMPAVRKPDGPNPPPSHLFRFEKVKAEFNGESWEFKGRVAPKERERPWRLTVALWAVSEEGERLHKVEVGTLSPNLPPEALRIEDGEGVVELSAETESIIFQGQSVPVRGTPAAHSPLDVVLDFELLGEE